MIPEFQNIFYLRRTCYEIHAFGLGFIQIKLTPETRLHLYTNKVRQTTEPEDIHDHRYGFHSKVLKGHLTNFIYPMQVDPEGAFSAAKVTCKKDAPGDGEELFRCSLGDEAIFFMEPGSSYTLGPDTFHRVRGAEGTLTYLTRNPPPYKEFARVIRRISDKPLMCPFSANTFSVDELWDIYEESVCRT